MVSSSPPSRPPVPPASGPNYSKIGSSSASSLEYSSVKAGYGAEGYPSQISKVKAFCGGYGVRVIACILAIVAVCLLLVLLVQGRHHHNSGNNAASKPAPVMSPTVSPIAGPSASPSSSRMGPSPTPSNRLSLSSLCETTNDASLCVETLTRYPSTEKEVSLQDLTAFVASMAWGKVNNTYELAAKWSESGKGSSGEKAVLQDCMDQLDQTRDEISNSVQRLKQLNGTEVKGQVMDVQVGLSSAYTLQDTCWEEFGDAQGSIKDDMMKTGQSIAPLLSMALTFAKTLKEVGFSSFYDLHS